MRQLLERINFPKVFVVLAVIGAVALGACGVTAIAAGKISSDRAVLPLFLIESGVIVLSILGLILMGILRVLAAMMGVNKSATPGTAHLFDQESSAKNKEDQSGK